MIELENTRLNGKKRADGIEETMRKEALLIDMMWGWLLNHLAFRLIGEFVLDNHRRMR